jgi:hypothetical protein
MLLKEHRFRFFVDTETHVFTIEELVDRFDRLARGIGGSTLLPQGPPALLVQKSD